MSISRLLRYRILAALVLFLLAYYGYDLVGTVISANRAGIPAWSALNQAAVCEQEPTSQCFADLAVLSLKPHQSLRGVGGVDLELRYVGRGDFADSAVRREDRRWTSSNQTSQRIYESVMVDTDQFLAATPTGDLHAYLAAYSFLQGDTGYFSTSFPVGKAVSVARARLGAPYFNSQTAALMRAWRLSLDEHASYSSQWLNFVERARELGQLDEAKDALAKAEAAGLTDINRIQAVVETWRLHGADAVVTRIEDFSDTNVRAEAYLRLSDLAADAGQEEWSSEMFAKFSENYDREEPIRHRVAWILMASRAARVAHALGKSEDAELWADVYAKETSFYKISERVRYSGQLYADIGLFDKAIAVAEEAIAHAPEPEKTLSLELPGQKLSNDAVHHQSIVGHAIGIYCQAGKFETAFELSARNPAYGVTASAGCLEAILAETATLQLAEVEERLGPASRRPLRTGYAVTLVERGNYERAAKVLESIPELPSTHSTTPRAFENAQLLRLAVAMRDEPLTRMIMRHIAGDADNLSGELAVNVFATVAAHTKAWPGDDDSARRKSE